MDRRGTLGPVDQSSRKPFGRPGAQATSEKRRPGQAHGNTLCNYHDDAAEMNGRGEWKSLPLNAIRPPRWRCILAVHANGPPR